MNSIVGIFLLILLFMCMTLPFLLFLCMVEKDIKENNEFWEKHIPFQIRNKESKK